MDEAVSQLGKRPNYVAGHCPKRKGSQGVALAALCAVLIASPAAAQPILIESRTSTNTDNSTYWSYPAGTWGTSGNLSLAATTPPFTAAGSRQTTNTSGPPSFQVQPAGALSLQPGTLYAVQVTTPFSVLQPPPGNLVVGISTNGVTNSTLPSTTSAFSTAGTNRWITLGQVISSITNPALTFTYVSGSLGSPSQRFYAQCVRFVPQAKTNGPHVWTGAASADVMWNNPTNWQGTVAPNLSGDDVILAGSTGLLSVPDGPFSVNSLKFETNAGAFIVGSSWCGPLSISTTNGMTNASSSNQVINVPISQGSVPLVVKTGTRTLTVSNTLSGTGGYRVSGMGTLYLRSPGDITGPVSVGSNATLRLPQQNCVGGTAGGAGDVTLDAGTLRNDDITPGADFLTANRSLIVGPGGAALDLPSSSSQSLIYNGVVANGINSGVLNKTGSGKLTLGGSTANTFTNLTTVGAGRLILNKSSGNAVAGDLAVPTGMVELAAGEQITDSAKVTISGGTFYFDSSFTETVGKVLLDSGSITGALGTLSADSFELHSGWVGVYLGGSGSLVKLTPNTVTLNADCSYTGDTTVSNGTLLVNGVITPAAVTVMNGGKLGGVGTIYAPVTVQSGGALAPGASIGQLTVISSLTLEAGSTSHFEIGNSPHTNDAVLWLDSVSFGGTLVVSNLSGTPVLGDSFQLFSSANYSGQFAAYNLPALPLGLVWNTTNLTNNGTLTVAALPLIQTVTLSGTNLVISGTGGTTNGTYHVLAGTNITTPLSNWTAIATNTFNASGAFNITNGITPALRQRFFILKLP